MARRIVLIVLSAMLALAAVIARDIRTMKRMLER
jgi:hypothetical protein